MSLLGGKNTIDYWFFCFRYGSIQLAVLLGIDFHFNLRIFSHSSWYSLLHVGSQNLYSISSAFILSTFLRDALNSLWLHNLLFVR